MLEINKLDIECNTCYWSDRCLCDIYACEDYVQVDDIIDQDAFLGWYIESKRRDFYEDWYEYIESFYSD